MIHFKSSIAMSLVVCFFCFMSGCTFIFNKKHLLSMLLSLEMIMISLFTFMLVTSVFYGLGSPSCFIILTLAACEAAVGLSVLVNMISSHGSSYVNSLNMQQC